MSTEHQRYSLINQAEVIRAFAQREGLTIIQSYEDAGRSGVTTARRDGLKRLLKDVVSGEAEFSVILVVDVSRWGRYQDPDEGAHYEFICRQAGVKVRYCAETFEDDSSPTSNIIKSLKRVMAADYSRQLSDRCKAGLRRQALNGYAQGGPAPYGVSRQAFEADGTPAAILNIGERRTRLDQSVRWVRGSALEISTVRKIFSLFLDAEMGLAELAHHLNTWHSGFAEGKPWTFSRVRSVLTNEVAIGYFVFNKRAGHFPNPPPLAPKSEWLRVRLFPGLVSAQRFADAQAKLAERAGQSYSDEEMIRRLGRLLKKTGTLSQPIINSCPITPCARAYGRRFGSLEAAYARLGFRSPKRRSHRLWPCDYSEDGLIASMRRLHADNGYITALMIDACAKMPTAAYVAKTFGGLEAAYARAGFLASFKERQAAGWARTRAARLLLKSELAHRD